MKDGKFSRLLIIAAIGVAVYLFMRKKNAPAQTTPIAPYFQASPIDSVYASNPGAFGPTNINLTVTPQLPASLTNKYVPLFGFVGMTQGESWNQ